MVVSFFGLFLVLGVVAAVVFYFIAGATGLPGIHFGSVSLNCPHCGHETAAHIETCQFCGKSFREEAAGDPPAPRESGTRNSGNSHPPPAQSHETTPRS